MAGKWPETPLGELVQNFDSRRVPISSREREKRHGEFPYYGATGIIDYVDDYLFEGLHLLVAEDGSVERPDGKPFLQLVDGRFWVNNHAHVLRGATDEDTKFIYYALSTVAVRPYMSGSVQAKLSQGNLNRIRTAYPTSATDRRAIAHILGTLDDKIELNRRMSETLEAIARALFKSWFVDFDPVRAKAACLPAGRKAAVAPAWPKQGQWCVYALECEDGSFYIGHTEHLDRRFDEHSKGKGANWTKRHPPKRVAYWEVQPTQAAAVEREKKLKTGSGCEWLKLEIARRDLEARGLPQPPCLPDRQVADLFPARLVDSELGEIPEGWDVGTLGDVAEHPRRGVRPEQIEAETPYIALEHMPKQCIALSDWGTGDGLESNKFEFKRGEILFGKLRPYFHKVGIAPVDGVCSTDIVVVVPRSDSWFGFTLSHVSSTEFVGYTNAGSTGTKMPRTNWTDMARYEVVLPPEPVAEAFTQRVQPSVDRIIAGTHECRTLAALRNTLLPKLISGELRVEDADTFMERVAS